MTTIFNKHSMKTRRRELRHAAPKAERILWKHLRRKQLDNHKFRRQHSINGYVVDFYCPQQRLAIEVDGPTHFRGIESEVYDKERQIQIESLGITVLRFTNADVYENTDNVILSILNCLRWSP
ncbi:endonuclease domain-containing protein [Candidatus Uhrbacteria bacterium]|nr:endonuclease domain-containing protein [Candidatus Uhrbacteria bacterium]